MRDVCVCVYILNHPHHQLQRQTFQNGTFIKCTDQDLLSCCKKYIPCFIAKQPQQQSPPPQNDNNKALPDQNQTCCCVFSIQRKLPFKTPNSAYSCVLRVSSAVGPEKHLSFFSQNSVTQSRVILWGGSHRTPPPSSPQSVSLSLSGPRRFLRR